VHLLAAMVGLALTSVIVSTLLFHWSIETELSDRARGELGGRLDELLVEAAVLTSGLATLLAFVVSLRMARPLHRLTYVAGRMTRGELQKRAVGSGGSREATELAVTLDRLAAALQRQDEMRRTTAADVTHELRGSLVGLLGRIEALRDGLAEDPDAMLGRMQHDARRLNRLVDDVLPLVDAQRPSLLMRRRPVDLSRLVRELLHNEVDLFLSSSVEVTSRLVPAWVEGDPGRLAQVLDNLISNALRYTDPGGRVTVRVDVRGTEAVLAVADTGIGIAPQHLERIFDRFWRVPGSDRAVDGTGVGLALVSDLVRAHLGRIDVSSRPGEGSQFRVVLPLMPGSVGDAPIVRETGFSSPPRAVEPVVWRARGAIDMSNARQIEAAVVAAMDPRTVAVVLDLDDVTFIDTTGVEALANVETHMRARGGRVIVVAGNQDVQEWCRLLGVDRALQVVGTFDAALDRLAGTGRAAVPESAGVRSVHAVPRPPGGKVAGPTSH
jgi:two-component system sensor histidine kinase BaeS